MLFSQREREVCEDRMSSDMKVGQEWGQSCFKIYGVAVDEVWRDKVKI